MKRLYLILFATAALAGCSRSGVDTIPEVPQGAGIEFKGTTTANSTRVSHEDGATTIKPSWVAGDRVGIFAKAGQSAIAGNVSYKATSGGSTTGFAPASRNEVVEWADDISVHDFYAYYPYGESSSTDWTSVPVSVPAVQSQKGLNLEHLAELDFMYASAEGLTKSDDAVEFSFDHLFSVLEVRLNANRYAQLDAVMFRCTDGGEKVSLAGASVNLATGALNISAASATNQIKLECSNVTVPPVGNVSAFMVITPGHAGKTFEVVAEVAGREQVVATLKAPATGIPVGITAVASGTITIEEGEEMQITDLSAGGTANTYVVNEPGTLYKFNAKVKGNGIARNSIWNGGSLSYNTAYVAMNPRSILVLWYTNLQTDWVPWSEECPINITSLVLHDGYAYFETPAAFVNGNLVIVALAEEGLGYDGITATNGVIDNATVLWSWNIIASEGYDPEDPSFQSTAGGFTLMDRDLGALISPGQSGGNGITLASTVGNYYQWGRKDPFPAIPDYMSGQANYMTGLQFTPTYTPISALNLGTFGSYGRVAHNQIFGTDYTSYNLEILDELSASYPLTDGIGLTVQNPHKWMRNETATNTYGWTGGKDASWRALWGNPTVDGSADTGKMLYDPCPPGWRVWSRAAYEAVKTEGVSISSTNRGFESGDAYFPLNSGGRNYKGQTGGYIASCGVAVQASYFTSDGGWNSGGSWYGNYIGRVVLEAPANFANEGGDRTVSFSYPSGATTNGGTVRCMRYTEVPGDNSVPVGGGSSPQVDGMENWDGWE